VAVLGVPLDGQDVRAPVLDGLDHAVGGKRGDDQTGRQPVDGLMVVGRDVDGLCAHDGMQPRPPFDMYRVNRVVMQSVCLDDVLVQCAAEGDVEHLHAPADRQGRQVEVDHGPGDAELVVVLERHDSCRLRDRLRTVAAWFDVSTAGQ
jgi:hypothetical protein